MCAVCGQRIDLPTADSPEPTERTYRLNCKHLYPLYKQCLEQINFHNQFLLLNQMGGLRVRVRLHSSRRVTYFLNSLTGFSFIEKVPRVLYSRLVHDRQEADLSLLSGKGGLEEDVQEPLEQATPPLWAAA